jgi:hypothetical protein
MRDLPSRLLPILSSRMHLELPANVERIQFTLENFWSLDRMRWMSHREFAPVGVLLCAAAAFVLTMRRERLKSWMGWSPTVRAIGALFGALLLLAGVCALNSAIKIQSGPLVAVSEPSSASANTTSARTPAEIDHALHQEVVGNGYDFTATGTWSVHKLREAVDEQEWMWVWFADRGSIFERWRVTWRGPKRISPHAVFVLRGSKSNAESLARVSCDLGDVPPDSPEKEQWAAWSEKVLSALR